MGKAKSAFIAVLVQEEIRRLIAQAVASGSMLSIADCVEELRLVYPNCGLSKRQLGDDIMMAAAAAQVAVEIGPK